MAVTEQQIRVYMSHRRAGKKQVTAAAQAGLPVCDDRRPTLILGRYLQSFLRNRRQARKSRCRADELFCLRCRRPRQPAGNMADYVPESVSSGRLIAICPCCDSVMNRYVSHASLARIQRILDVSLPTTEKHIAPGERLRLQNGSGDPLPVSIWHTADGCVSVENWYPETTGDVTFSSFKLTLGSSNVLHDGPIKVYAHAGPRPFWHQKPKQLSTLNNDLLTKYGPGSENASEYEDWKAADNTIYGRGLTDPGMGATGERDDLGAFLSRWDACYVVNPTEENAEVVRSQGDEAALEPFHLLDPQTNKMLLVQDYPEATFLGVYLGKRGPIADFTTENEQNLSQATAHAPSFGLGGVLAFITSATKYANSLSRFCARGPARVRAALTRLSAAAGHPWPALLLRKYLSIKSPE